MATFRSTRINNLLVSGDVSEAVFDIYGIAYNRLYLLQRIPHKEAKITLRDDLEDIELPVADYINLSADTQLAIYLHVPSNGAMADIEEKLSNVDTAEWFPPAGLKRGVLTGIKAVVKDIS